MSAIKDLDILTAAMTLDGFRLIYEEAGSMDSGQAEYSDGTRSIRILKDRSQWMFEGPQHEFEALGLWKAFSDTLQFRSVLQDYVSKKKA